MEQRDYIMREIEKIGALLRAIRRRLFGGKRSSEMSLNDQFESAREELLNETNFDLNTFLHPDTEYTNEYILGFAGFSAENIELLADFLAEIGRSEDNSDAKKYLGKALQLYDLCALKSNAFSFEREKKMNAIKSVLNG